MVYLEAGDQYADYCLGHLEKFLRMIDRELSEIQSRIDNSQDPDSDEILDLGEYMIGYGFVAIQRCIISTYKETSLEKWNSLRLGYKLKNGLYLMEALNAGANYWKHEPEWRFDILYGSPKDDGFTPVSIDWSGNNLEGSSKRTYDLITKITPYREYTLSNLLAELLKYISHEGEFSFSPFLPFIEQWRNEADASSNE